MESTETAGTGLLRISRTALERAWREPQFLFHYECTPWYDIVSQKDGALTVRCAQATEIVFYEPGGIGYDVPIPGAWELHAELCGISDYGYVPLEGKKTLRLEGIESHAQLRHEAVKWLVSEFGR